MKGMTIVELEEILALHKKWLNGEDGGVRANLRRADLREADLREVDLREADLREADLHGADLREANLREVDLREVDLHGADLDFSCWPLWCGSFGAKVDKRIFVQLLYHICRVDVDDEDCKAAQKALYPLANQFHRVDECGKLGE